MFGSGAVSTHIPLKRVLPTRQANLVCLTKIIFSRKKASSAAQRLSVGESDALWFCFRDVSTPSAADQCLLCVPCILHLRTSSHPCHAPANAFPLQPSLAAIVCCWVSLTAASSLCTEVNCRIYLCSFSVPHCSLIQQTNYILAQKMNRTRAVALISSCLAVCSLPIQLCLKQFSLKHFKTFPISPHHF